MKLIFLFLIGLCFLNAQTNSISLENRNTNNEQIKSFLDLFPLHIGNFWQFKVKYVSDFYPQDTIVYYANKEVLKDTLMLTGLIYKEVYDSRNIAWPHQEYLRVDSLTECIFKYDMVQNEEYLIDSLKMIEGDMLFTGYDLWLECINVDSINSFGEIRQAKHFSCFTPTVEVNYKFAEGIGEIFRFYREDVIVAGRYWSEITYAKINGNEFGQLVNVGDNNPEIVTYSLAQNYPNPFNPSTNIGFRIAEFGFVSLKVYDVLGNEIATLVNEEKPAGEYEVEFNATGLPSGIYFYQLQAGQFLEFKKMILLK